MNNSIELLSSSAKDEVLYQLLRSEYGYYKAIQEITLHENEKLSGNLPMSELQPLLKKKKILLSCIHDIETKMFALKSYWQSKKDKSDFLSKQINQELMSLNKLLKEILQLDLVNQKILETYLATLRRKSAEENAS